MYSGIGKSLFLQIWIIVMENLRSFIIASQEFCLKTMDKTEADDVGELGRPKKCPRIELPESQDTNEIDYGEETGESEPVLDVSDDNLAFVQAPEGPAAVPAPVIDINLPIEGVLPALIHLPDEIAVPDLNRDADLVVPDVSAPTFADYGNSSSSKRRRPRKGAPKRSPLF